MSDEEDAEPLGVLKAPVEAAEPLRALVEESGCQVLKRGAVERLEGLAEAVDEAQRRSEAIVEEARREATEIRDAAREEARSEAYRELADEIRTVRERYRGIQREAEEDTVALAMRVAERIVGRELETRPELVRQMVADSLEHVRGKRHVVVEVHPKDLEELESGGDALEEAGDGARLYFEPNDEISRGGCVIESDTNRVDARLEVQLERLYEALVGE